jgi:hypothetical protein
VNHLSCPARAHQPPAPILRTPRRWAGAERAFPPILVAPDTTVEITSADAAEIDLVLTFAPRVELPKGVRRVAAFQSVDSDVLIDFTTQAALYWLASVLKTGELAPNQAAQMFDSNADTFRLQVTREITISHDSIGWSIPSFDPAEYIVNVGFGVKIRGLVYWAYSVSCDPDQQPDIKAGSYELVRSNGAEQIGDPVFLSGMSQWRMPMGHDYVLAFDAMGNGVLKPI